METRRSFLGKAAAGVAALYLENVLSAQETTRKKIDVNAWMKSIKAEDFEGIGEVIPYPVEGAEKLLVVINQGHFSPKLPEQWMYVSAEQCQIEIYTAIEDLRSNAHTNVRRLLVEGVVAGKEEEELRQVDVELRRNLAHVNDTPPGGDFLGFSSRLATFEEKTEKLSSLNAVVPLHYANDDGSKQFTIHSTSLAQIGAANILAYRKLITMNGAEDETTFAKALSVDAKKDPELYEEWANKRRERNVIQTAALSEDQITYVVFGLIHDWKRRIDEWNKESDTKVSLLQLRPKEMVKVQEWLEKGK